MKDFTQSWLIIANKMYLGKLKTWGAHLQGNMGKKLGGAPNPNLSFGGKHLISLGQMLSRYGKNKKKR